MNKKLLFLLPAALIFSIALLASSAFAFRDIEGSWAESTIQKWQDEGRISGFPDGTFRPEVGVTRAEFISMVNPLFGFTASAEAPFSDVSSDAWFYDQVGVAVAAGIISGYPDGSFGPNEHISRQEIAVVMSQVLGLTSEQAELPFRDADRIAEWASQSVASVYEYQLMSGSGTGAFRPHDPATRAETVVVLERAYQLWLSLTKLENGILDAAGTYGPETGTQQVEADVTIAASGVVLRNVHIEGDLLIAASVGEGDVTLQGVTVSGTTSIEGGGSDSIYLIDSTFGTIVVDKAEGRVRIVLEGRAEVDSLDVRSAAMLETNDQTAIRLLTAAASLEVLGNGAISEAVLEAADVSFEFDPLKVVTYDESSEPSEEQTSDQAENDYYTDDDDAGTEEGAQEEEDLVDSEETGEEGEEPSDEENPVDEENPTEEVPGSNEPLVVYSASASIGGQSVSASMSGNNGTVNASSFSDEDRIGGISIQTSSNVERVSVSAFGISRTITLNNGSGSMSVSDILSNGVSMGLVRSFLGSSTSIGGTLYGKDGQEESFSIDIRF